MRLDVRRLAIDLKPRSEHGLVQAIEALGHEIGSLGYGVILRLSLDAAYYHALQYRGRQQPEHLRLLCVLKLIFFRLLCVARYHHILVISVITNQFVSYHMKRKKDQIIKICIC